MKMTAKEYYQTISVISDAGSDDNEIFSINDMIRFAQEYHDSEMKLMKYHNPIFSEPTIS